jgi:folate-binding protein YgfZ
MVQGPDAAQFLQGQLTNSVLGLDQTIPPQIAQPHTSARLLGYCTPKGRLIASFWGAWMPTDATAEDRFVLFVSKDIAATTAKRLSMYVLRSRVKVIDVSDSWQVSAHFGLASEINSFSMGSDQIGMRIPDVFYGNHLYGRVLTACEASSPIELNTAKLEFWNDMEVMSGIPRIVLSTQEQFVPQMINFESTHGVDFKKGCYPGQEIVARSQYRGAIKRRLFLAHFSGADIQPSSYQPGVELFHSQDPNQPAGMVVLSSKNPLELGRIDLQVECKLEALEGGNIYLGSPQGPVLKIDALPYDFIEI